MKGNLVHFNNTIFNEINSIILKRNIAGINKVCKGPRLQETKPNDT